VQCTNRGFCCIAVFLGMRSNKSRSRTPDDQTSSTPSQYDCKLTVAQSKALELLQKRTVNIVWWWIRDKFNVGTLSHDDSDSQHFFRQSWVCGGGMAPSGSATANAVNVSCMTVFFDGQRRKNKTSHRWRRPTYSIENLYSPLCVLHNTH